MHTQQHPQFALYRDDGNGGHTFLSLCADAESAKHLACRERRPGVHYTITGGDGRTEEIFESTPPRKMRVQTASGIWRTRTVIDVVRLWPVDLADEQEGTVPAKVLQRMGRAAK
jgi:hypothetical protein